MPANLTLLLGLLVIALAVLAAARGVDVRLALFIAALALGAFAGDVTPILRTFLVTLSSEQFVVPICTAMGFAHVLRHSGCDQHLVHLLTKPLRHVRPLLIPGAVLVGFLVNISVISQASTAVAVGTVLVPLLRAARLSPTTVGATLALGASIGGELLNPGAPEMNTVARRVGVPATECVQRVGPLLIVQLVSAIAVFWPLCLWAEARSTTKPEEEPAGGTDPFRVNLFKAAVPVIPLLLLMVVSPPLNLLHVPEGWLIDPKAPADPRASYGARLIGASMLIGVALATLAAPRGAGGTARAFFEGAGYALTHIVSVIVIASCFGEGIKQLNLDEPIRRLIAANPDAVWPLAGGLTLGFAALSGSGMAATQSLYGIYVSDTMGTELMLRVGALVSICAAAGRTMSPAAAVLLTSASLTNSQPLLLARRVAVPLLVASCVTVAVAWWRGG
jgi:DcuC family C4-dicarboxylate transporter